MYPNNLFKPNVGLFAGKVVRSRLVQAKIQKYMAGPRKCFRPKPDPKNPKLALNIV